MTKNELKIYLIDIHIHGLSIQDEQFNKIIVFLENEIKRKKRKKKKESLQKCLIDILGPFNELNCNIYEVLAMRILEKKKKIFNDEDIFSLL